MALSTEIGPPEEMALILKCGGEWDKFDVYEKNDGNRKIPKPCKIPKAKQARPLH